MWNRIETAECGGELGRVDDEGCAELVGGLAQLPQQRGEDAADSQHHRPDDGGFDGARLAGRLRDEVEELLGGERLGRGQVPDLPVCFGATGED
jgi:hypothetical protein